MNKNNAIHFGLLFYLLLALALPLGKALGWPPAQPYGWWPATSLLWAPWALLLVCILIGTAFRVFQRHAA